MIEVSTHPLFIEIQQALYLASLISLPLVLAGAAATLLVGIFQSASQLHDQTISAVPRLIAMYVAAAALGVWALKLIIAFGVDLWSRQLH